MPVPASVSLAYSDVLAIEADTTLTPQQRVAAVALRRGQALRDHFSFTLNAARSVTLGDTTLTIAGTLTDALPTEPEERTVLVGSANGQTTFLTYLLSYGIVELWGVSASRGGADLGIDPHQQFGNPALLVPDPAGSIVASGARYRVDPAGWALGQLLSQVAP